MENNLRSYLMITEQVRGEENLIGNYRMSRRDWHQSVASQVASDYNGLVT